MLFFLPGNEISDEALVFKVVLCTDFLTNVLNVIGNNLKEMSFIIAANK